MEAKSQVESGAVDCGDSDEEQIREVSSPSGRGGSGTAGSVVTVCVHIVRNMYIV